MPGVSGELGTGSAGTTIPNRAVPLSGWFGARRFANLSGVLGTHHVGYLSYLESGAYDWILVDNASRLIDWTYCGIPGGIPVRTTIYTSLGVAGQLPSYAQSVTAAQINSAIVACPADQVVYLYPGTYGTYSSAINFVSKSGATLRGAGAGRTIINSSAVRAIVSNEVAFMDASGATLADNAGLLKGSFSVTLTSSPGAGFFVGNMILITQADSPDVFGTTGIGIYHRTGFAEPWGSAADRSLAFVSRITDVTGNVVTFATPIPWSYTSGLTPKAFSLAGGPPMSLCGVEDMTIVGGSGVDRAVSFIGADRCWTKNVEARNINDSHGAIFFSVSSQSEIRRCYVHDAYDYPNQSDGYGYFFYFHSCYNRVEDNIGYHLGNMLVMNGASANAILNNYSLEIRRGGYASLIQSIICNHGPHGLMNLFEGNITARFQSDGYHGSSSHITLFRNHINGLRAGVVDPRRVIDLCRGSYYFNVIGNIIGDASWNPSYYEFPVAGSPVSCCYILGFPNMDNTNVDYDSNPWDNWTKSKLVPDADVAGTLLRHGNYDYFNDAAAWDESIESHSIPDSLIYESKPAYFGSLAWPAIGPDVNGLAQDTPAKHRWDNYVISADLDDLFADEE